MSNLSPTLTNAPRGRVGTKHPTATLAWLWDVEEKVAALRAGATMDHPDVLQTSGMIGAPLGAPPVHPK